MGMGRQRDGTEERGNRPGLRGSSAQRMLGFVSLYPSKKEPIPEGASIIGYLTTVGRVSGRPHTVRLRLVRYGSLLYASRRNAESDWCRNLIATPGVTVDVGGHELQATARLVDDRELVSAISALKYGDARACKRRVIVEIRPG